MPMPRAVGTAVVAAATENTASASAICASVVDAAVVAAVGDNFAGVGVSNVGATVATVVFLVLLVLLVLFAARNWSFARLRVIPGYTMGVKQKKKCKIYS